MWAKWISRARGLGSRGDSVFVAVAAALPSFCDGNTWLNPIWEAGFSRAGAAVSPQGWDYVLLLGLPAYRCLVVPWRDMSMAWRIVRAVGLPPHEFHHLRLAAPYARPLC